MPVSLYPLAVVKTAWEMSGESVYSSNKSVQLWSLASVFALVFVSVRRLNIHEWISIFFNRSNLNSNYTQTVKTCGLKIYSNIQNSFGKCETCDSGGLVRDPYVCACACVLRCLLVNDYRNCERELNGASCLSLSLPHPLCSPMDQIRGNGKRIRRDEALPTNAYIHTVHIPHSFSRWRCDTLNNMYFMPQVHDGIFGKQNNR